MSFSTSYNMVSMVGKFGKRILIEQNLGNNCLMIWGRSIEREDVVKFAAWMMNRFDISADELEAVLDETNTDPAYNGPKPLPLRSSFALFLADYKARMNK